METLLNRYRNITVLLLVIMGQLVLLAVSAKDEQDVRMIRVWTVTAVTPAARIVEWMRGGGNGFLRNYILLHDTSRENRRLQADLDKLKLENVFLKNELNTADRAKALLVFQSHTPSKTVAATIVGTGAGSNSKVVLVDRGTVSGVQRGMGVITPDGIVGKVFAAYPTASQVLLITDPDFAAGVVARNGLVRGTLKGQGTPQCKVDYVAFEEKVEPGEMLFTSGDDRIFPRGFPVGVVKVVRPGQPFKEILVEPSGLLRGLEDVLILVQGVHQEIPDTPQGYQPVYIAPPPPAGNEGKAAATPSGTAGAASGTEADRLRTQYKAIGEAQGHKFGEGPPGTKPPDFNLVPEKLGPGSPTREGAGGQARQNPSGPEVPAAGARGPGAGGRARQSTSGPEVPAIGSRGPGAQNQPPGGPPR